jgi:hypothetical protein
MLLIAQPPVLLALGGRLRLVGASRILTTSRSDPSLVVLPVGMAGQTPGRLKLWRITGPVCCEEA